LYLKNLKEQKDKIEALREELEEIARGDGSNFMSSKRFSAMTEGGKLSMMSMQGNPFEPESDASTVLNSNEYQQLQRKLERLQNERDKYKGLYEKSEAEVSNLNDELQEINLKHQSELKAVRSNLDVRSYTLII
jgi:hypothetical protein